MSDGMDSGSGVDSGGTAGPGPGAFPGNAPPPPPPSTAPPVPPSAWAPPPPPQYPGGPGQYPGAYPPPPPQWESGPDRARLRQLGHPGRGLPHRLRDLRRGDGGPGPPDAPQPYARDPLHDEAGDATASAASRPCRSSSSALLYLVYGTIFCGSRRGQTVGMMAVGVRAVRDGTFERLGYTRAGVRALTEGVLRSLELLNPFLILVWLIDVLYPVWDKKRQTLHDKAGGSVVLRGQPPHRIDCKVPGEPHRCKFERGERRAGVGAVVYASAHPHRVLHARWGGAGQGSCGGRGGRRAARARHHGPREHVRGLGLLQGLSGRGHRPHHRHRGLHGRRVAS